MDFEEVTSNVGESVKKTFKNKKFLVVAGGVGVVALVVGYMKNKQAEAAAQQSGTLVYSGYPTVGGSSESMDTGYTGGGNDAAWYEMEAMLNGMQAQYDSSMDALYSNITTLSDQLVTSQETITQQQAEMAKQQGISQMRANSELYYYTNDQATRDALHAENLAIADALGLRYDTTDGHYYDGASVAYTVPQTTTMQAKPASQATVTFSNNVDYQNEINKAILNGSPASVINNLNAQRAAKIAATGMTLTQANSMADASRDYTALIQQAKNAGADASVIANLEAQRAAKVASQK